MSSQLEMLAAARAKKRHAHLFEQAVHRAVIAGMSAEWMEATCSCGLLESEYAVRQRRGRNNRSRGGRAELAVARTYGGEKVGPLGLPEDIRGKQWATQVKVSNREAPPMWRAEFGKLAGQRDRTPRLILRFARQGVKAEDYIVVRGEDWLAWFGRDE